MRKTLILHNLETGERREVPLVCALPAEPPPPGEPLDRDVTVTIDVPGQRWAAALRALGLEPASPAGPD